jgi:hypothetical protein
MKPKYKIQEKEHPDESQNKMTPEFRNVEGGLFSKVQKADVGDGYIKMASKVLPYLAGQTPSFRPGSS